MRVFVIQRKSDDKLLQGSNLVATMDGAWTSDIREAALYAAETRAVIQRDKAREAGIECRIMVLFPQPW